MRPKVNGNTRQTRIDVKDRSSWADIYGSGISIRPFEKTEGDYEAIVEIENANTPDSPFSTSEYRYYDESWNPAYMHERMVAEENGRIVGFVTYGEPWWSRSEGKYFLNISVHPERHHSGIDGRLFEIVMSALQSRQATHIVSDFREDQRYLVDLMRAKGLEAVMRYPLSELDVQRFDEQHFASLCARVRDSGIRVDNLRVVAAEDKEWKRKLWDLEWEIVQDVPSPSPHTRMTFEHWQKRVLESPNFFMEGQIVARDGEKFVGMSGLRSSEVDPKKFYTGLTGVIRTYRRQGIATAMKVKGILFARANGIVVIETDNEENNPMLDLNKQLGFKEKPAFVSYEKRLEFLHKQKENIKIPA